MKSEIWKDSALDKNRILVEHTAQDLINAMVLLNHDDRCSVFHYLESNVCQYCGQVLGGDLKKCHCMNDE